MKYRSYILILLTIGSALSVNATDLPKTGSTIADTKVAEPSLKNKPSASETGYQLQPEDVLEISVWKEEGLKKEVLIRPDGGLSFPLVGELQAAGMTAAQLQQEITQRLEKFIPDPVVSVAILKVAGNRIFVIGKVNKPGEFPAGRYVDVLQVLSMAGGFNPFPAEKSLKVLRKQGGEEIVFPFKYAEVKKGENLQQNIQLQGGDVVVVP